MKEDKGENIELFIKTFNINMTSLSHLYSGFVHGYVQQGAEQVSVGVQAGLQGGGGGAHGPQQVLNLVWPHLGQLW